MAPRAAAGTSPKRTTGGPQTGGRPHPAAGPLGGAPPGEVGLGAGGARAQARPPTPRQGGHSQRPGHRPHGRAPRRGGCGPPHPGGQQRDRTQADHRPGAPPPATSPHQRRRGRPGRGRTRPGRCDGAGAASAAKKMAGGLSPRLDTTGRKKCGEDALSPPLAVTADTRYPPVRRSSPKRTRCRPVPCALAMRRLPRPPSCLP